MKRALCVPLAAALLAASLGVATGGAQGPPQTPPPPSLETPPPTQEPQRPIFRTEANFVRVDVFATIEGVPVQDLAIDDFEVFEDNAPQRIETFEHVVVRPATLEQRVDPGSMRRMLEEAAEPRNRVFVVFLDPPNVTLSASMLVREPLIRLMDRLLGPGDLVGFMTVGMSAAELTLARRTEAVAEDLRRNFDWGMRFRQALLDDKEGEYVLCYPLFDCPGPSENLFLARELIARKRERATLEALDDLAWHLGGIREERKAVLVVSEGWLLYKPDPKLMNLRSCKGTPMEDPPGVDPIGVGPGGRITRGDPRSGTANVLKSACDEDRMKLANLDDERFLRDVLADANRNNVSFYPIDPRGLVGFDTDLGTITPPPVGADVVEWLRERVEGAAAALRTRQDALEVLALNTDGIAIVNSNDLDAGLKRVADDMSSYYLLGYYSANAALDGRFRSISVRVKRPGVAVRARRGYRAATEEEVASRYAAVEPPDPGVEAVEAALGALGRIRPDTPFRLRVVPGDGGMWVAGEIEAAAVRARGYTGGGTVEILASSGGASGTIRVSLGPGERAFLTWLEVSSLGEWVDVQARLAPADRSAPPLSDAVRAATRGDARQPLLFRRGPATGNRVQPAADPRFSRAERLRLELPVGPGVEPGVGRVLDQKGQPLVPPVEVGVRTDEATGQRWVTADVTLAPLGQGDYVIEVTIVDASVTERILTAIRVTR